MERAPVGLGEEQVVLDPVIPKPGLGLVLTSEMGTEYEHGVRVKSDDAVWAIR
jgi:hypothetical protein